MTNPVILLGTQSNGETLPVQVDATGRLVAEGLPGSQGEKGDKGDQGDPGPKGDQGDPGQDGKDGEGLPEPYGFEGSVLTIVDGEPAWAGGTPPPPTATLQNVFYQGLPTSLYDSAGNNIGSPEDIDGGLRQLPCWSDPLGTPTCGAGYRGSRYAPFQFTLDFERAHGKIFEVIVYMSNYNPNGGGEGIRGEARVLPVDSNLSWIVSTGAAFTPEGPGPYGGSFTFSALCTRDTFTASFGVEFTNGQHSSNSSNSWLIQSWTLKDPDTYLLAQYKRVNEQIQALRGELWRLTDPTHSRSDFGY